MSHAPCKDHGNPDCYNPNCYRERMRARGIEIPVVTRQGQREYAALMAEPSPVSLKEGADASRWDPQDTKFRREWESKLLRKRALDEHLVEQMVEERELAFASEAMVNEGGQP